MNRSGFFPQDRSLIYKTKSRGVGDRLVRANVAQEKQKRCRNEEINKRRRIPLSSLEPGNQITDDTTKNEKEGVHDKDNAAVNRRQRLQKWLDEKKLRKQQQEKEKKKAFVVGHVSHSANPYTTGFPVLPPVAKNQKTNPKHVKSEDTQQQIIETKRVTRSATREKRAALAKENQLGAMKTRGMFKAEHRVDPRQRTNKSKSGKKQKSPEKTGTGRKPRTGEKHITEDVETKIEEKIVNEVEQPTTGEEQKSNKKLVTYEKNIEDTEKIGNEDVLLINSVPFQFPTGPNSFFHFSKHFKVDINAESLFQSDFVGSQFAKADDVKPKPSFEPMCELVEPRKAENSELGEFNMKGNSEEEVDEMKHEASSVHVCGPLEPDETKESEVDENNGKDKSEDKNGVGSAYFRNLVESETSRLQDLSKLWEMENNPEQPVPEEVQGMIRTVLGQVQLLVTKKFKQFKGLIDISEDPNAEKKTLCSDLQGFWDMMYFQVEDIDNKFKKLEQLKLNHWEEPEVKVKKVTKKKSTAKKTTRKPSKASAKAADSRNKFRQMRSQMKAKLREENNNPEGFTMILSSLGGSCLDGDNSSEIYLTGRERKRTPRMLSTKITQRNSSARKSSSRKRNSSAKRLNSSIKTRGSATRKGNGSEILSCSIDQMYFQPSTATPADEFQKTRKILLFTPTAPSESELATPTPSKLTKTPMPDTGFLSPPMNVESSKPTTDVDLIFFSPTPSKQEPDLGSITKLAEVTPRKKLAANFQNETVFSPVRRSARIERNREQFQTPP